MKKTIFFLPLFSLIFAGCLPASQDISGVKGEVAQLQIEYKELYQKHAALYAKADNAFVTLDVLSASIHDLQNQVSVLNQQLQDFQVLNKKRGTDGAVLPSDMYQTAYSDFAMGKYDLALEGFQSFIAKYPNVELAQQAQYYIGESLYSQNRWKDAIAEYRKVEQNYKDSGLVAAAKLKIALAYEMLGKKNEAINEFNSIIKKFPQSSEALTAKEKIRIYNNAKQR